MADGIHAAPKLQRIMIDGGFTCPNRDGSVSHGGCTFCRPDSFTPDYCRSAPGIAAQIEAGKRFFAGKYPEMRYIAYFQAYSGTYAPLDVLRSRYMEALRQPGVVGLTVATRPDCLGDDVIALLVDIERETEAAVTVEIGVETLYDRTLRRINRGHSAAASTEAIRRCSEAGLRVGVHLIIGLPGETEADILAEADMLSALPISSLKMHQLLVLSGTAMARDREEHPDDFLPLTLDRYTTLAAAFLRRLRPDIIIERYASSAPPQQLIAPKWGVKPAEVERRIREILRQQQR